MPNDRLRDAFMRKGLTPDGVAERLRVDPKTVERWITKGRTPYPSRRHEIAAMIGESERYLWPDAIPPEKAIMVAQSELLTLFPHRNVVPVELWNRLLDRAEHEIGILVYVGMFLTEHPTLLKTLRTKGESGTRIRLLFGNPTSREVSQRGVDEGIGRVVPAKVRNALAYFRVLDGAEGIEIRCHATVLYNSIFRYDEDMIVNPHVYGFGAPHAPALHLRRLSAGDLFDMYAESFEKVWATAKPPTW